MLWCIFLIEGCIYPTHAPMHNAYGLPGIVRLFHKLLVLGGSLSASVTVMGTYLHFFDAGEQGLQDKIKLVPINLQNRPTWYKEKVYPPNKVKSCKFFLRFYGYFDVQCK